MSGIADIYTQKNDRGPADSAALWLCRDSGLSKRQVLLPYRGGLEKAQLLFEMTEQEIRDICIRGAADEKEVPFAEKAAGKLVKALGTTSGAERRAQAELLYKTGVHFTAFEDDDYPHRLAMIPDPPVCLYYRGCLPPGDRPSVAIIGARVASRYGLEQARRFAWILAMSGVQIVSGMARGIDGAAGQEALEAGGATYALLGCGPDICYPRENRKLYDALCSGVRGGGVISEYPPGTQPIPSLFPLRNRLISGLSDIVLVVEARDKSGTLITVGTALDQGKEVYAIPGRIGDSLSNGCNRLLQQGAHVALEPEDLLDYFWGAKGKKKDSEEAAMDSDAPDRLLTRLAAAGIVDGTPERALWDCLDSRDLLDLDVLRSEMSVKLQRAVSIRETGAVMARLIVKGFAEEPCTGYYCRAVENTFKI